MTDGVSNEPVIAATPTPLSVEPRTATPAESAEVARQAEEAKLPPAKSDAKVDLKDETPKPRASIREAIRNAEAKVNAEPVAQSAKPISVAAKEGESAPAAKAEPAAKTETKAAEPAAKSEPVRGEDGKFVSTKAAEPAVKAEPAKGADPATKPTILPSHTAEAPPARMSAKAKEEWASLPDESRAEVTRMEKEFKAGFEKYKGAAERDSTMAEFHDMAGKSGKNLKDVVANYVAMENQLRADPIKGFEIICQNAGLSLKDVAAKILNQTPDQAASKADATVIELRNEIAELKKGLGTIAQERQAAQTNTTTEMVTKFAAEHPRFEELADEIAFFLKTRTKDLAEAYALAERIKPASAAPAEATAPAASEAPPARSIPTLVQPASSADAGTKSIAGTPTAGSDPVTKRPSNSIREAIRRATAAAG